MRTVFSPPRKAFSLVEVILAVGVLSMALMTLVGLLGSSFQQVNDVVQTNRALSVVNYVNSAFENPELIAGDDKIAGASDKSKPVFNTLYTEFSTAIDNNKKTFYCFNSQLDTSDAAKGVVTIVAKMSGNQMTRAFYDDNNGTGPVFRIDVSVSNLLEGQHIYLDTKTYEPTEQSYSGGSLPDVNQYALAYLPLLLEIYPQDIDVDASISQQRDMKPILSQNIVINR